MRHRQLAVVIALLLGVIADLGGQAGIGPVTPKAPMTLEGYEKRLSTALKSGAVGKLWERSDAPLRMEYFMTAQELSKQVPQVVIGPVTPKPINPKPAPPPVAPKPGPGPNPPTKPPTKKQFEDVFKDLHTVVELASKANPGYQLPTESARAMQRLLDSLVIKP